MCDIFCVFKSLSNVSRVSACPHCSMSCCVSVHVRSHVVYQTPQRPDLCSQLWFVAYWSHVTSSLNVMSCSSQASAWTGGLWACWCLRWWLEGPRSTSSLTILTWTQRSTSFRVSQTNDQYWLLDSSLLFKEISLIIINNDSVYRLQGAFTGRGNLICTLAFWILST